MTGGHLFGREEDLAFLDRAWATPKVNIVTVVAWAGVGKSTLLNHWLRRLAADGYRGAEFIFGWSFYRQGTTGEVASADEFLDAALSWFGDVDPRRGTAWDKGERLARLIGQRRTLLVLDGLEPLRHPPAPMRGAYASRPSRRSCASWRRLTRACVWSPHGCRWPTWLSTRVVQPCGATWTTFPLKPACSCSGRSG